MLELEIVIEWTLIITIIGPYICTFADNRFRFSFFLSLSPFLYVSVVFNPLHDEAKVKLTEKHTHINAFK